MIKRLADRFFKWYCNPEFYIDIRGDLEELYQNERAENSKIVADIHYAKEILLLLRLSLIRPIQFLKPIYYRPMIQNYLKIAYRYMMKQKLYSVIKIGGFSLGIAACFLIALFIQDELSYDKNYKHGDRVYRFVGHSIEPGDIERWTSFPAPIGASLRNDFPDIEKSGRIIPYDWYDAGDNQFRPIEHTQNLYEDGFIYADQAILEILEVPMVYGDQTQALAKPNTIVISKNKADKYFPDENPVGRIVILNEDESTPFTIGGVMEDFPSSSHLQCEFLISLEGKEFWEGEQASWCCWNYDSYIRLKPGAKPEEVEEKLLYVRDNYIVPYSVEQGDARAETQSQYLSFELQPVSDIYINTPKVSDMHRHGDMRIVWIFGIVAGFILLLACINFINLSTAKSANRAKEVGLRKVVGSLRSNLIRQFLAESLLFSLISFVGGILLAYLFLQPFNRLADKSLVFPWTEWWLFPIILGAIVFTGMLAGIYPSLYLSSFKPIDVLKGKLSRGSKNSTTRSALVIFQFTTSIVLIICTVISYQQMEFILNKKIGYDKDQVVLIEGANTLGKKQATFKSELNQLPEVLHSTVSSYLPIAGTKRDFNSFWKDGRSKIDKGIPAQIWRVDSDYMNTLGMKLVEGRVFSEKMPSDSNAVIINQTMAQKLGLENPIGEKIMNWETWNVIGVVEDFYFESLKGEHIALCFALGDFGSNVAIKVRTDDMASTLNSITNVWDKFLPNQPIRYAFMDQRYAEMYEDVKRTGNVFSVFAGLAIIVACLGLFALSAFMMEQRRKEVSIRKVLGASVSSLLQLLTVDFLKLILISLFLAIPIGWYAMQRWLEDYALDNRIEIGWGVFFVAGVMTLFIAVLTISYESIKLVRKNPADSLRTE